MKIENIEYTDREGKRYKASVDFDLHERDVIVEMRGLDIPLTTGYRRVVHFDRQSLFPISDHMMWRTPGVGGKPDRFKSREWSNLPPNDDKDWVLKIQTDPPCVPNKDNTKEISMSHIPEMYREPFDILKEAINRMEPGDTQKGYLQRLGGIKIALNWWRNPQSGPRL
jgi:hypothetical protein